MARIAVIGEPSRISGYLLAGALLCPAGDRAQALAAWRGLPADVAVAVLTPAAAGWLDGELSGRPLVLPVVLPGSGAGPLAAAPAPP